MEGTLWGGSRLCSPSAASSLTDGAWLVNSVEVKGNVNNWNQVRKRKIFCDLESF
jgi:hypothetical protein